MLNHRKPLITQSTWACGPGGIPRFRVVGYPVAGLSYLIGGVVPQHQGDRPLGGIPVLPQLVPEAKGTVGPLDSVLRKSLIVTQIISGFRRHESRVAIRPVGHAFPSALKALGALVAQPTSDLAHQAFGPLGVADLAG